MRAFNLQNQKGQPYITAQDATINFTGIVKKDNAVLTTSNELNAAVDRLEAEIAGMASVSFRSVIELPATGEPNVIYLVPKDSTIPTDVKDEYIWVDNQWETIGTTDIDLSTKQDKLEIYAEDVSIGRASFLNATVDASKFTCGPITLTGDGNNNSLEFGCNYMCASHYQCGPTKITNNDFTSSSVRIDSNGICVNYNGSQQTTLKNGEIQTKSIVCTSIFKCGPVKIDPYTSTFNCGPVDIESTSFICGPVKIDPYTSTFNCGPVEITTAFVCGPVQINDQNIFITPNNDQNIFITPNPRTITSAQSCELYHQQICRVNISNTSTFILSYVSVRQYCTGEIWLDYAAAAPITFPSDWYWIDDTSSAHNTPPTFQVGNIYFIVLRNDGYRTLARVADYVPR